MSTDHLDLARLVRGPEGLYFERKSLFEGPDGEKKARDRRSIRDDVAEVTAGFANQDGGILVLGVEDDGTITGHRLPSDAVEDVLMVPERRLAPPLRRGERAVVEGVEVLVFEVESAPTPVMVQGNGYPCRVGDAVVKMEANKIAAWKEQGLVETWEARRSERSVDDLEPKLLIDAIAGSALAAPTAEQYLLRRRLADKKGSSLVLRRATELLFAREPHLIDHPNAGIRVFRVIGTERKTGAHHNVDELPRFEGNVADVLRAVTKRIQGLLRRPKRLRGLRFEESPEYPTFAWQEAVINAVAHRDYALTGRCVEVWLYDDRMEVTSPGGLVAEVPIEALHRRERVHMSRNPRLVRGLVDLDLMREQGEGIPRMFAEMEVQFLSPPELRVTAHEFSVTLRNSPTLSSEDAEWLASLQAEQLSDGQARAMALARIRGRVSNADLRDVTGLDTLAASVELRDLRDRGLLELHGAGSASHYVVGPRAEALAQKRSASTGTPGPSRLLGQTGGLLGQTGGFTGQTGGLPEENRGVHEESVDSAVLLRGAPPALQDAITGLGGKPSTADLRRVVVQLCELRWWTPRELAAVLKRKDVSNFSEKHLSALVKEGRLVRRYPETPAHPQQAYRAVQPPLLGTDGVAEKGELMPKTKERHFEDAIEADLLASGGWTKGNPAEFDRSTALVAKDFFAFVESTQPETWKELQKHHPSGLEAAVTETLIKALDARGTLDVLRHGFKFLGKKIECAYFKPAHGMNPDILAKYARNRLVVTRQLKFIPEREDSVDLGLFVNGFPIATVELKNPLTNQTVEDARAQYCERDPRHALFRWKTRALVHFAVDPDLVYMTTRLAGKDTSFLPFNRGAGGGGGNPDHPSGYRTGYLWQEVWQRDSFLDILGRFAHLAVDERKVDGKLVTRESLVFPRYHQLDVVRKLDAAARTEGAGHSYLIQHSAGSGKSNSIAWLAHRLSSLHDDKDRKVFDSVVVVTDRRVLDQQLQATIYQFEHKNGVVQKVDEDSQQLADALTSGTPIIITTLQKFPFVTEKIGKLPNRRYALIVDEAHSSQTGEGARHLKEVLAAKSLEDAATEEEGEEPETSEDRMTKVMASRGKQANLSFFAFTATPKAKTLEIFGHRDAEGKPKPFHLYSMRQAIEERFILDVLKSYTTYKAFYRLVKAAVDDPKVNKKKATSQLARFMSLHPHNIAQKTEVMVEHFRAKVGPRIGGKAKAMVVTSSRLHAVRYKQAFDRYIAEQKYDIGVLVAFSGVVKDPDVDGVELTEVGMNKGVKERELPERFESDEFQVLLVANKYQTGFDQPLLHTMYVDKRLSGVQAVQTLSRLNRTAPGKEDTFVLDFVNDADEIERSFQPYFEQTTVADTADPSQLYELQHRLEAMQVFWASEVEAFCAVFFAPDSKKSKSEHAEYYRHLTPAVDRFRALDEETQDEFRNALAGYVGLYAFLSQVMPFTDPDLEKLYTFGRFLQLKLPRDARSAPLDLDGEVALRYYRLQKMNEGSIPLALAETTAIKGPTALGSRTAKDTEVPLSEIIDVLNERFGTEFTRADQLLFDQFVQAEKEDQETVARAQANSLDNFELAMKPKIEAGMIDRMDRNQEIVNRYLNDAAFQSAAFKALVKRIYDEIRGGSSHPPPPSG